MLYRNGPHPGLLQIEAEEALDRVTTALQVILCCTELTMNVLRAVLYYNTNLKTENRY